MNHRIPGILIALLTLVGGSRPIPAGEATQASTSGGITEIILERTWCYGRCPIDQLLLRADGTAAYTGMENARRTGQFTGRISREDFDQLSRWLVAEGYFRMGDSYGRNNADAPSSVVRVTRGGERKSVINYAMESSLHLWGMERAIGAAAADIQWQPASSGIRVQILRKDQAGNWLPQPGWPIWVTPEKQGFAPSGTRERYVVTTDGEGKFAISLAPGTYQVSDGFGNRTSTQVIVERDKFTAASVQLESAIIDTPRNAYTPPPPPPGDGLYRYAHLTPAVWLYHQGSEMINLGERVEPAIQDRQLWSDSKDNTTFRLGLAIPYDPVVNPVSHILIVNGKAYRQEGSGSRGRETSHLYFRAVGAEDARRVAEYFSTPIRNFRDPGYQVLVSLTPTRASFSRGEEVTATLQIHNPGSKGVQFSSQSMRTQRHDYYTLSARRNGQPVTDISFSGNRGGRVYPWDLLPGATFVEEKVRLNEWFEFREPGTYDIHAVFRLDFRDSTSGSWLSISWTDTVETDFTVVID